MEPDDEVVDPAADPRLAGIPRWVPTTPYRTNREEAEMARMSAWYDNLGETDCFRDRGTVGDVQLLDCFQEENSRRIAVLIRFKNSHGLSGRDVSEVAHGFLVSRFGHTPRKSGVAQFEDGYLVELRVDRPFSDAGYRQEFDQLVTHLQRIVERPRRDASRAEVIRAGNRLERRVLDVLAGLLPVGERRRFVAEVSGELGDCGGRWERLNRLLSVTLGMPRLAWMMHRENRHGRAR